LLTDDPSTTLNRENVGLYRQDAAGLVEIARDGQPTPSGDGTLDLPFFNVSSSPRLNLRPMFNDAGQVAFLADLADTTSGNEDAAIYLFDEVLGLTHHHPW